MPLRNTSLEIMCRNVRNRTGAVNITEVHNSNITENM